MGRVKHEDTLRRFTARIVNEELDLNMDRLREKIISLFKFAPDTQLHFTYNDEDNDVVGLLDDEDLHDAVRQALNPLRITVSSSTVKILNSSDNSSGSSSPSLPSALQEKLRNLNSNFSEILKSLPEPIREPLSKLSSDLAKKASTYGASNMGVEVLKKVSHLVTFHKSALPSVESRKVTSGASCGKPASSKTKKVLKKTKSSLKKYGVDLPRDPWAPGFKSSLAYEKALVNTNTSHPVHPIKSNAHVASMDKEEVKETGDKATPHVAPKEMPERIFSCSHGIFHRGIRCDGCSVHPITGPRFKSKVKEDYDLCSSCFAKMGNDGDFTMVDHPVVYRHSLSFKGSYTHNGRVYPQATQLELDSCFILDVNILDGTIVAPLTQFTKIWRMRNNGTTIWPQGTRLACIGGVRMTTSPFIELEIAADGVQVDQELDVAVNFIAPELHGRHISYWRTTLPTGQKFGQLVWVLIEVDAFVKKATDAPKPSFDLNFPPAVEGVTASEDASVKKATHVATPGVILNSPPAIKSVTASEVDVAVQEPMMVQMLSELNMSDALVKTVDAPIPDLTVHQSLPEPNMPNASVETIERAVDGKVSKEQEAKFPIDDSLLVGGNVILASDEVSADTGNVILASDEVNADAQTEKEKLLKKLEEACLKQVYVKEILEKKKYDLEQKVDDLCGCSEWDHILEELEEMGFNDEDTNKRLSRKSDE
ncbi:hypothetical protein Leryth_021846 [Lithospermum erythrorhizon]|nr:hypothetical protein Leryth_021846 [Lithospermum erythrorhizon]